MLKRLVITLVTVVAVQGCAMTDEEYNKVYPKINIVISDVYNNGSCVNVYEYDGNIIIDDFVYSLKNEIMLGRYSFREVKDVMSGEKCAMRIKNYSSQMEELGGYGGSSIRYYKVLDPKAKSFFDGLKNEEYLSSDLAKQDAKYVHGILDGKKLRETIWGGYLGQKDRLYEGHLGDYSSSLPFKNLMSAINFKSWDKTKYDKYLSDMKAKAESEERERIARQKFSRKQKENHKLLNQLNKLAWSNKGSSLLVGDKVCTFDNKMGYVEGVANNKLKILWAAKLTNQAEGFFFGNMSYSNMDSNKLEQYNYKYQTLNRYSWLSLSEVGACEFNL